MIKGDPVRVVRRRGRSAATFWAMGAVRPLGLGLASARSCGGKACGQLGSATDVPFRLAWAPNVYEGSQ